MKPKTGPVSRFDAPGGSGVAFDPDLVNGALHFFEPVDRARAVEILEVLEDTPARFRARARDGGEVSLRPLTLELWRNLVRRHGYAPDVSTARDLEELVRTTRRDPLGYLDSSF